MLCGWTCCCSPKDKVSRATNRGIHRVSRQWVPSHDALTGEDLHGSCLSTTFDVRFQHHIFDPPDTVTKVPQAVESCRVLYLERDRSLANRTLIDEQDEAAFDPLSRLRCGLPYRSLSNCSILLHGFFRLRSGSWNCIWRKSLFSTR